MQSTGHDPWREEHVLEQANGRLGLNLRKDRIQSNNGGWALQKEGQSLIKL